MTKENAGGPDSGEIKRALGKTSRETPVERWPERDEEDRERCREGERAKDLLGKTVSAAFWTKTKNKN